MQLTKMVSVDDVVHVFYCLNELQ